MCTCISVLLQKTNLVISIDGSKETVDRMLQKDGDIVTELPYVCMWFFYGRDKQDYLVTW